MTQTSSAASGVPVGRDPAHAERGLGRPALERPLEGRLLAGVCAGIAGHLGMPVRAVRFLTLVLTVLGGGLPAYLFLWALVPEATHRPSIDPASGQPSAPVERALSGLQRSRHGALLALGGLLVAVGALVILQGAGLDVRAGLLVPLLVIAAGAVVVWSDLDEANRSRALRADDGGQRGWIWLRIGLGITLAVVGILVLTIRGSSVGVAVDALLAAVAVLVGVAIISAPWILRLWASMRREQEESARANERADIAAHLHDSVLQTLALIQRRSTDPAAVAQLARAQERELRAYLYAGKSDPQATLAAAVAAVAEEVEDLTGIPIDLVVTGDRPIETHGQALAQALREALLNATRHGRPPVTAYVEIGGAGVDAFVRDRGAGFDVDRVPSDRLGVRQSILGRMERHGGEASIRRREDGTEVVLRLPALTASTSEGVSP